MVALGRDGLSSAGAVGSVHDRRWRDLLALLGLTGFAISQPMLSLLGGNPTVLAFYAVDGGSLVLFAVGVALLPPLVLWILGLLVTALSPRAGRVVHLLTVATLVTLCSIQIAKAVGLEREWLVTVVGTASGVAVTWCYARFEVVATWVRLTSVLPAMAVFAFLVTAPSSALVEGRESVARSSGDGSESAPVVVVLLDELPTRSILDGDGNVDAVRFPNLARFAEDSTWYRHYTSVAPATRFAVPAMLTGNRPRDTEPLWTSYPDNLFSLLAPTHDLVAFETATRLCGFEQCTEGSIGSSRPAARLGALVSTTADLFRERVSPSPNQGARMDTFEEDAAEVAAPGAASGSESDGGFLATEDMSSRLERVDRFTDALPSSDGRPALSYLHLMLPHLPWRFYETGASYDPDSEPDRYPFSWTNRHGDWVAALTEQRHLLQAQYTDLVLGDLMGELRARGLYDESLVIVAADHGISFEAGRPARTLPADGVDNVGSLAYAPLFVKAPGQTEGSVDDANLLAVDVLPTVADILGIEIPFPVEGAPAGSSAVARRSDEKYFFDFGFPGPLQPMVLRGIVTYSDDDHMPRAEDRWIPPIEEEDDPLAGLYRRFGLGGLIGADIGPMITRRQGTAVLGPLELPADDDAERPLGLVSGRVTDLEVDAGVVVAALDGQIVAASPLYAVDGVEQRFALLFPAGAIDGELRMAVVDGDEVAELALTD